MNGGNTGIPPIFRTYRVSLAQSKTKNNTTSNRPNCKATLNSNRQECNTLMAMVAAFIYGSGMPYSNGVANSRLNLSKVPQNSNLLHNSYLTSVTIFDGSDLTDTVVRSNSFWSTLSSKLPYFLAAELLATITFVAIASVVASQGQFLIEKVTKDAEKSKQFKRLEDTPPVQIDFAKLLLCIFIDILGSANEAIPLVGELVDVVYAPVAALLLRQLFNGSNVVFLLEVAEEILPFTDILPLATICWVCETFFGDGNLAKALRIGKFAPNEPNDGNYIDVRAETKSAAAEKSKKEEGRNSKI